MKRREIDLYPEDIKAFLPIAEKYSERDYLIFRLQAEGGFRIGEVVGSYARKRESYCPICKASVKVFKKKGIIDRLVCEPCGKTWESRHEIPSRWIPWEAKVTGLMVEDLREDPPGIWVKGKMNTNQFQSLNLALVQRLRAHIGKRKAGKIFDIGIGRCEQTVKRYAREAGIKEAQLIHPHRFRHFVGSELKERKDIKVAQDFLRHKSPITTLRSYVRQTSPEKKQEAAQTIEDLIR